MMRMVDTILFLILGNNWEVPTTCHWALHPFTFDMNSFRSSIVLGMIHIECSPILVRIEIERHYVSSVGPVWSLKELVANKVQFFTGSPVCTIDRSSNFFVSAPPILMRACTPHNNLYQSAKVCLDISNWISNLDDNTLVNNCKVFSN